MKEFTTEELRTIVWLTQNEAAHIAVREHHKNLDKNETYQRIVSINKKAHNELTDRIYAE